MGDPPKGWFGKSNETILGNTISLIPVCLKMGVCRDTHKFQQTSVSLFPPCLDMIKIHSVPRVPQFLQFIADVLVPQLPCRQIELVRPIIFTYFTSSYLQFEFLLVFHGMADEGDLSPPARDFGERLSNPLPSGCASFAARRQNLDCNKWVGVDQTDVKS